MAHLPRRTPTPPQDPPAQAGSLTTPKRATQPKVFTTPTVKTEHSARYGRPEYSASARYHRLFLEGKDNAIGPIDLEEFFAEYMPVTPELEAKYANFKQPVDPFAGDNINWSEIKREAQIYDPLIHAIEKLNVLLDFVPANTSNRGENHNKIGDMKPDITLYSKKVYRYLLEHKEENGGNGEGTLQRAFLAYAALIMEGKMSQTFKSDSVLFDDKPSDEVQRAFGQMVAYAAAILARQHRTFIFTVYLHHSNIRFLRWDRSGCVVTKPFDCATTPEPLVRFLWRFARLTDEQQGYDMSVRDVLDGDEDRFQNAILKHLCWQNFIDYEDAKRILDAEEAENSKDEVLKNARALLDEHLKPDRVVRISVYQQQDASSCREYLISRPVIAPLSVASRGTRGWWAVPVDKEVVEPGVVFLKDFWQSVAENVEEEGWIATKMSHAQVSNVSEVICYGDVPATVGPTWSSQCSGKPRTGLTSQNKRLAHRVHRRIVLADAGYDLSHMRSIRELLTATRDALETVVSAYDQKDTLHRDLSVGNIILFRPPAKDEKSSSDTCRNGIVIDWEHSCTTQKTDNRLFRKSGTFAFLSINNLDSFILQNHSRAHTIYDDFESIFWIVVYCALRWTRHDHSDDSDSQVLLQAIKSVFGREDIAGKVMFCQLSRLGPRTFEFRPALEHWLIKIKPLVQPGLKDPKPSPQLKPTKGPSPRELVGRVLSDWNDFMADFCWQDEIADLRHVNSLPKSAMDEYPKEIFTSAFFSIASGLKRTSAEMVDGDDRDGQEDCKDEERDGDDQGHDESAADGDVACTDSIPTQKAVAKQNQGVKHRPPSQKRARTG